MKKNFQESGKKNKNKITHNTHLSDTCAWGPLPVIFVRLYLYTAYVNIDHTHRVLIKIHNYNTLYNSTRSHTS